MNNFIYEAIKEAKKSLEQGGIPIGSVIVYKNKIIGRGHNKRIQNNSVILHAEMDAFENAGRQTANIYKECTLYTSLSPCPMCSGAILLYGIPRVIIGENENFKGSEELLRKNGIELTNLNNEECKSIMSDFIKNNKDLWFEDIAKDRD